MIGKVLRDFFFVQQNSGRMLIRAGPLVSFLTVSDRKNSFFIRVGFSFSVSIFALTLKTKLMTEQQSLLFREILDLNWEFTHESDWSKKWELAKTLSAKKQELRESMGHKEYDTFIETGRKMFAPLEV